MSTSSNEITTWDSPAGLWTGDWGGGALLVTINDKGQGSVQIPNHSNGAISITVQNGVATAVINRDDRLKQGFVCRFETPQKMVGTYVHFNASVFTTMYLEKCASLKIV